MKRLCLIRHAKSSWTHPSSDDVQRPLDLHGEADAILMGTLIQEKGVSPDIILASIADRSLSTAKLIAQQLEFPVDKIEVNKDIYEAGVEDLLTIIKNLPKKFNTALLVGHNPGLTWLANYLAEDHLINLPTCGVYCMEFGTDDWLKITEVEGKTLFFDYPKCHVK